MPTILDRIVEKKWAEIEEARHRIPLSELQALARHAPAPRSFVTTLCQPSRLGLIAEVKKASPSKGVIRADFDPVQIAKAYAEGGAHALSVLTDETFFQGSLDYLRVIRSQVHLPVLRKDFILDPYQVYEARAAGADAILLIAECLEASSMKQLYDLATDLGMGVLIELYDAAHLPKVLATGTPLVGVNNRDLRTFEVDLGRTIELRKEIPLDRAVVGESGIAGAQDAKRLWEGGIQAILVGETLMRQSDLVAAVRDLLDFSS
ncbi:MAG: indole-3-glycerol phosphate synthase TrpC [Pirellulales bacterium]